MKKWTVALAVTLLALVVVLPGLAGERAQAYEITVFDYPDSDWTNLSDINDRGEIVGYAAVGLERVSFVLYKGAFTTVAVPGAAYTYAVANNDRGAVAGWYVTPEFDNYGFVLDRRGNLTTVAVPDAVWTDVLDVNNRGTVVGFYSDGGLLPRGYIYADGVYTYPIDIVPPGPALPPGATWLQGINERGQIAGTVTDYFTYSKAFVMEPDGALTWYVPVVPDEPNPGMGFFDLNDHGQAVGAAIAGDSGNLTYTGWLMDRGEDVLFTNIPGAVDSWIRGINNRGDMVGLFLDSAGNQHGFIISR